MIYEYCRVSTKHQCITCRVAIIQAIYPIATIIKAVYTGSTQARPLQDKLKKQIQLEDINVYGGREKQKQTAPRDI